MSPTDELDRPDPKCEVSPVKSRRLQVSLLTLFLLVSACGVWIAERRTAADIETIELQLPGLRLIARELIIADPTEFAAVSRVPSLYGELIWDVYVPELDKKTLQMCMAMDEIAAKAPRGSADFRPLKKVSLSPGKHVVELVYNVGEEHAVLTVLVDGEPAIKEQRPKDWVESGGHSGSSMVSATSKSFSLEQPINLLHRRFMIDNGKGGTSVPKEPCSGILLWVEVTEEGVK